MVTSPDGKGVFLIAGYKAESRTAGSTIYEYRTKWHELDEWRDDKFYLIQSLSFGRYYPIAFFLPNEYAKCSKYIHMLIYERQKQVKKKLDLSRIGI